MNSFALVVCSVIVTTLFCALVWRRPSRSTAVVQRATPEPAGRGSTSVADLDDDLIELVLTMHYRQVLADPGMQKIWRKLLREASAVRTVQGLNR